MEILGDEDLKAAFEDEVSVAALKWINRDLPNRKKAILEFTSSGIITITVNNIDTILKENQICKIASLKAACEEAIPKWLSTTSYQKLHAVASKWWFAVLEDLFSMHN